jgi:UDP-N-acetylglucosamine 2-epimerase (non-hydrolysing)
VKVCCVIGTRPDVVKAQPIVDGLDRAGLRPEVVHTGQHYDRAMRQDLFADVGLRQPDATLEVGPGSYAELTGRTMVAVEQHLATDRPDWVVVIGASDSALAAGLVAAKIGCRLAHVEAGLRSRGLQSPEDVNRSAIDRVSDLLLAPSADAADNLRKEGFEPNQIHLVGNPAIDTLRANLSRARSGDTLERLGLAPGAFGLVTLHRPSNVDHRAALTGLVDALGSVAEFLPLLWPVHPRLARRLEDRVLPPGVRMIDPVGYLDFLALQDAARVVLTDSAGAQDETTALGVPCLTLRTTTERPITITEGTNRLVGVGHDAIVSGARHVLATGVAPRSPKLWDGNAGKRIASAIAGFELTASNTRFKVAI